MIQNVLNTNRRVKVRVSEMLRVHFLSLARRVVTWRQSRGFSEGGVVVGVTSVERKAGCSVVGFNLAAALARLGPGNVLFVETRFGSGAISRKVPRPGYGLAEMLTGDRNAADCICETGIDRLFVLGCGRAGAEDAIGLPFESLQSIHTELCSTFDYVVVDLPLANEMTHCFPVASHVDGVLLVNTPDRVQQEPIQRAVRRFRELSRPVIGLVLNKA